MNRVRLSNKLIAILAFLLEITNSQDYDYPAYSEDALPHTSFSCRGRVNGGYYADVETDCQMYHVCSRNKLGALASTRFLCGNGTVFDQRHLVCQDYRKVRKRCHESAKYFRKSVPSILEILEARLRSEKPDQEILDEAQFDSGRF